MSTPLGSGDRTGAGFELVNHFLRSIGLHRFCFERCCLNLIDRGQHFTPSGTSAGNEEEEFLSTFCCLMSALFVPLAFFRSVLMIRFYFDKLVLKYPYLLDMK